jgi:effector-binding domain-containing protein
VWVLVARPFEASEGVSCSTLPAGPAAVVRHTGDYAELGRSYDVLWAWIRAQGAPEKGLYWERYGHWDEDPDQRFTWLYRQL